MSVDAIYGRLFRVQKMDQPRWRRALEWLGVILLLGMSVWWINNVGSLASTYFRLLPASLQIPIGKLAAFYVGSQILFQRTSYWTQTLFLQEPVRDLALTPGTPRQILRIVLRINWFDNRLIAITASAIFLGTWFWQEWISFAVQTPSWSWVLPIASPLGYLTSALLVISGQIMLESCAIALCMLGSVVGVSGYAARLPRLRRALLTAQTIFSLASLVGLLMVLGVAMLTQSTGLPPTGMNLGQRLIEIAQDPSHPLYVVLACSPTSYWFDAFAHTINGPYSLAQTGLLGCGLITFAALGIAQLIVPMAYSDAARLGLYGSVVGPKPAQVADVLKRSFDPDAENGPIERWLIRRFGRMARATLRLMLRSHEAGSFDELLKRTIMVTPFCLAIAWAVQHGLPEILNLHTQIFQPQAPLSKNDYRDIAQVGTATVLACFYLFRLMIFWSIFQPSNITQAKAQNQWFLGILRVQQIQQSRGDSRIPLNELYAVGYSDALLLPTFYIALWSGVMSVLMLGEALALDLPVTPSIWAAVIVAPALPQIAFLIGLLNIHSYCKDYRRSYLSTILRSTIYTFVIIGLCTGIAALVALLIHQIVETRRPLWIAYVGTLNAILVFDVALYMITRMLYVRRRFDPEYNRPN